MAAVRAQAHVLMKRRFDAWTGQGWNDIYEAMYWVFQDSDSAASCALAASTAALNAITERQWLAEISTGISQVEALLQ